MKKIAVILVGLIFLGCSGEFTEKSIEISLENNTPYAIYEGDELVRVSTTADVNITHRASDGAKFVIVNSGDVKLIRGEYFLAND